MIAAAPPPPSGAPGSEEAPAVVRVGAYEVRRRLAIGGMAEVFEGWHAELHKQVAIKVLRCEVLADAPAPVSLLDEARAANRVRHRALIDVFDLGVLPDGRPYLVMELLDGATIAELITTPQRLPLEDALLVVQDVFEALAALHQGGVVHGDLSPRNVVAVRPESGRPYAKLLDFGLAHVVTAGRSTPISGGTPRYLAPERIAGAVSSPASDVFAAAAVAYEVLSWRRLGGDNEQTSQQPLAHAPLSVVDRSMPIQLSELLERALCAAPEGRPTAASMVSELRALERQLTVVLPRAPTPVAVPAAPWWRAMFGKSREKPRPLNVVPESKRLAPAAVNTLDWLSLDDLRVTASATPPPVEAAALEALRSSADTLFQDRAELPAFPGVAARVVDLAGRAEPKTHELVSLIHQDPTLTGQLLRAANSASNARGTEVLSARDAIVRLGFTQVCQLAAAVASRAVFTGERVAAARIDELRKKTWERSVASAYGAHALAAALRADSQRAFLGGLLHDVGKEVALRALERLNLDISGSMEALVEAAHVELGMRLAASWELPAHVARFCAEHHQPAVGEVDRELHIVRLVSALVSLGGEDGGWHSARLLEVTQSAKVLGLDRFRVRATATELKEHLARAAQMGATLLGAKG